MFKILSQTLNFKATAPNIYLAWLTNLSAANIIAKLKFMNHDFSLCGSVMQFENSIKLYIIGYLSGKAEL